jgi:hypothetical protein
MLAKTESTTETPAPSETLETPAEVVVVAPKIPEMAAQPVKEYLALRVFATIAGPKWDQMAGFVSHAHRMKLGPLTMADWQSEFKKFQEKPVG